MAELGGLPWRVILEEHPDGLEVKLQPTTDPLRTSLEIRALHELLDTLEQGHYPSGISMSTAVHRALQGSAFLTRPMWGNARTHLFSLPVWILDNVEDDFLYVGWDE